MERPSGVSSAREPVALHWPIFFPKRRARNETRCRAIAECDRPSFVEQKNVHVASCFTARPDIASTCGERGGPCRRYRWQKAVRQWWWDQANEQCYKNEETFGAPNRSQTVSVTTASKNKIVSPASRCSGQFHWAFFDAPAPSTRLNHAINKSFAGI